jgi:hypothetical protein
MYLHRLTHTHTHTRTHTELEDFLITNRPEYLHHSAQNYTLEQKDYNNTLTARLIEYAEQCGYGNLLHLQKYQQDFGSFTAVRDRIRGYYKSHVQSSRRREQRRQNRLAKQQQQQEKPPLGQHQDSVVVMVSPPGWKRSRATTK